MGHIGEGRPAANTDRAQGGPAPRARTSLTVLCRCSRSETSAESCTRPALPRATVRHRAGTPMRAAQAHRDDRGGRQGQGQGQGQGGAARGRLLTFIETNPPLYSL